MSDSIKKSNSSDIGKVTRKAMGEARQCIQRASASLEKYHKAKAILKAAKKDFKQAKKNSKKDAKAAAGAQEKLKLLLKRSGRKKRVPTARNLPRAVANRKPAQKPREPEMSMRA